MENGQKPREQLGSGDPSGPVDERWPELLQKIVLHDQSALAEFYDSSKGLVYGTVLRIVEDAQQAEEVALDVYLKIWHQADRFDPSRGRAGAWLMTIARRKAIDCRRSIQRRDPVLSETAAMEPVSTVDPQAARIREETRQAVRRALGALPVEQREALELAFFPGLSHGEIAERLGQPLGTVKTRIRLGIQKLRTTLGDEAAVA